MDPESLREFIIGLPAVEETFPFGESTLVFKVKGKMFALTDVDEFTSINLKCEPERAVELREQHEAILPGYHMNKKHWNTVLLDGSLSDLLIRELIVHSYQLVVAGLPKKIQTELQQEEGFPAQPF
jgi:predicted DNA-binding protein (MmcQ/YjbR family)